MFRQIALRRAAPQRSATSRSISTSGAKSVPNVSRFGRVAIVGVTSMLILGYYRSSNNRGGFRRVIAGLTDNAQDAISLDASNTNKPILANVLEDLESHFSKDKDTGVSFPNELENVNDSGVLKLLGLGVRTVSFLRIRVYSLGIYAEESAQKALSAVEVGKGSSPSIVSLSLPNRTSKRSSTRLLRQMRTIWLAKSSWKAFLAPLIHSQ